MSKVVLLSGGLDSAVTAWAARQEDVEDDLYALSFNYGQRHAAKELSCAEALADRLEVQEHRIVALPSDLFRGSSLIDRSKNVPVEGLGEDIPSTWVPQRNSLFLVIAFSWAEVLGADSVWLGANAVDYSGYPDCRPYFFELMEESLNLASKRYVTGEGITRITTPVIGLTKAEEIRWGRDLGVPFEFTWSCYQGYDKACGVCDSCRIRLRAFSEAGLDDPIDYEE